MFAVMRSGGKQYRVALGDVVLMEKLAGEVGSEVAFGDILLLRDGEDIQVGAPLVEGASVKAEVLAQERGPKVVSYKRRRRKASSSSTRGHRQELTRVRITAIGDSTLPKPAAAATAVSIGETKPLTEAAQADDSASRSLDESDSSMAVSESNREESAAAPQSEADEQASVEAAGGDGAPSVGDFDQTEAAGASVGEEGESANADANAEDGGDDVGGSGGSKQEE